MSRLSKLVTQILLSVWLLLLPWQTHYVVTTGHNQFTILRLYGYDLIFILLLCSFIVYWYQIKLTVNNKIFWLMLTLLILISCSAYWASDRAVAAYYLLHVIEACISLGIVLSDVLAKKNILLILTANGLIQTGFIIWQQFSQQVVANKWLGMAEQLPDTSGTPVLVTSLGRFLRSFGTLPHPNIAAGVVLISLCAATILWLQFAKPKHKLRYTLLISFPILTLGLLFTFSRAALIAWVFYCIGILISQRFKNCSVIFSSLAILVIISGLYWPLTQTRLSAQNYVEQISIQDRWQQLHAAMPLLLSYWPVGLGVGNYTLNNINGGQPLFLTPILIVIEIGLFGAILYYYLFGLALAHSKHYLPSLLWLISCELVSLFDHYFWTIPSLLILWFVVLALNSFDSSNKLS
ncbi:MAG: hypothetical protein WCW27_04445 [Patescibacteria group bacterium]|jgi:hypothetical protein